MPMKLPQNVGAVRLKRRPPLQQEVPSFLAGKTAESHRDWIEPLGVNHPRLQCPGHPRAALRLVAREVHQEPFLTLDDVASVIAAAVVGKRTTGIQGDRPKHVSASGIWRKRSAIVT